MFIMDDMKKLFTEFQCKCAYKRVLEDKKNGKVSSEEDLHYASIYENNLADNNLIENNAEKVTSLFDFNSSGKIDFEDYQYYSDNNAQDIDGDGQVSDEEKGFFEFVKSVLHKNLHSDTNLTVNLDDNVEENNDNKETNVPDLKVNDGDLQKEVFPLIFTEPSLDDDWNSMIRYLLDQAMPIPSPMTIIPVYDDYEDYDDYDERFDLNYDPTIPNTLDDIPDSSPVIKETYPDDETGRFVDDIRNLSDEDLIAGVYELLTNREYADSNIAKNVRMALKAYYAEGLSRDENFFYDVQDRIENAFDEINEKIDTLRKRELASECDETEDSKSKFINAMLGVEKVADKNNEYKSESSDDKYSELAQHLSNLLKLDRNEELTDFGECSNGDFIFRLNKNGKKYNAVYKKLEDGSQLINIDKSKEDFDEMIFDDKSILRERTVKKGNVTTTEGFKSNGVKTKTVTENLPDGSIKTNVKTKFTDGTVCRTEKFTKPNYKPADGITDKDISKESNKGSWSFINIYGEKTGTGSYEFESKADNEDTAKPNISAKKTSKGNSKKVK